MKGTGFGVIFRRNKQKKCRQVLKLYAWETSFEKQVLSIRNAEIRTTRLQECLKGIITLVWASSSFLVYAVTFAVYVLLSDKNILDPKTAFVSLSLFNILKMPFFKIPDMVSNLVECSVSIKRINQFLNCEDLNSSDITHEKKAEALIIENGSFSWERTGTVPILRNINIKIDHEALVAVVGPVGSGKSSLISAFLGEMYKLSGFVNTTGTVAYVPQQAWIQNATLKENITFGEAAKNFDYNHVLEACALKPDLKSLPAGDLTEIGDKGINLSGGQKQRISLARAVYHEADVYFLDDPLSAVDAHVSKHLFQQVIGPKGLLKKKTRVLVTHNVTYLSQVDFIFVIKEGTISESGSFQELMDSEGQFSEFMATYLEGSPESDEKDFDELKEMIPARKTSIISQIDPDVLYRRRLSAISNNGGLIAKRRSTIQNIPQAVIEQKLSEIELTTAAKFSWHLYAYYVRSIGFPALFVIIILNILLQTLSISTNMWLVEWTNVANDATPQGEISSATASQTGFYLLIFASLGLSKCIVEFIADMGIRLGCWTSAKILHNSMLHNFFRLPLSFMDVTSGGRILSRFSRDVDVVDCTFPAHMSGIFFCTGDVVCNLIIVSCSTPIFVTVILPLGLLYYLAYRFYVATSTQLKRLESKSRSEMYSHFVETVVGAQSIRAYGLTGKFINKAEENVDLNQRSYYPSIVSNRWLSVRTDTISNLTIFFAALFAVLDRDTISPGNAGLSIGYTLQITMILSWLIYKISEIETNMVSIERIKEYTEKPQEAAWEMPNESIPKNWPSKGNINFLEFQVRYRDGLELVLKNITFFIRGGQKVGIVGRTGGGKSSLALSLFRILESAGGKILIDGINIATLGLHTVRSKLTIIPQDPVLFAGSLRMNLDPFQTQTDDKIWNALELAHLKPFVSSLEDGLQSEVTEGGENFSVGQRQLICLARALLRKTKILILDEATAAVDLETDDLIQSTIRNEFQHCTVLTIAHRLNTIMDYDKIIVLDNGYVVEYDTLQKLLQSKESMFYKMASDASLI